jgi:hypothetical protein
MYSFFTNRGNKDNIQYLYDYVKQSGTPVGEFSDFRKSLRNSENRKYLYDFISSRGEKIGSLEEFDQAIGFKKKTRQEPALQFMDLHHKSGPTV